MFDNEQQAFVAIDETGPLCFLPGMANRHGLITGATGTGKTVTLQNLAETFSQMGVPVFAADVKGDLSGVAAAGGNRDSVTKRVESCGLASFGFAFQPFPVQFWDVYGEAGAPIRTTIDDMGPLLLSRLLGLNDIQAAVLTVIFKIAKDQGLLLDDLKDVQKLLEYAGNNAKDLAATYGNLSMASIGAIQRGLVSLEHEGVGLFFGEPALFIEDLLQTEGEKGVINILAADKLMGAPRVYTTLLLWLLTKLFEVLPEVGDPEKPRLVFFFDEAHLLFNALPKVLEEKIFQIVRLIRSKGVGVYFISQSPSDIPDTVLGQLGNRIQHALRAYTPKEQKAVKAAAQSFRANPAFSTEEAITQLGTGEALVSFLDAKGAPQPVARAFILPPQGQVGPLDGAMRQGMVTGSLLYRHYAKVVDGESAHEVLVGRMEEQAEARVEEARLKEEAKAEAQRAKLEEKAALVRERQEAREEERRKRALEKAQEKQSAQVQKAVSRVASGVVVPLVRQFLSSVFKGK